MYGFIPFAYLSFCGKSLSRPPPSLSPAARPLTLPPSLPNPPRSCSLRTAQVFMAKTPTPSFFPQIHERLNPWMSVEFNWVAVTVLTQGVYYLILEPVAAVRILYLFLFLFFCFLTFPSPRVPSDFPPRPLLTYLPTHSAPLPPPTHPLRPNSHLLRPNPPKRHPRSPRFPHRSLDRSIRRTWEV